MPLTDAFLDGYGDSSRIVEFARQLERELIRITWERDALLQSMDMITSGYGSEVTARRTLEELARMRSTYEDEGGQGE